MAALIPLDAVSLSKDLRELAESLEILATPDALDEYGIWDAQVLGQGALRRIHSRLNDGDLALIECDRRMREWLQNTWALVKLIQPEWPVDAKCLVPNDELLEGNWLADELREFAGSIEYRVEPATEATAVPTATRPVERESANPENKTLDAIPDGPITQKLFAYGGKEYQFTAYYGEFLTYLWNSDGRVEKDDLLEDLSWKSAKPTKGAVKSRVSRLSEKLASYDLPFTCHCKDGDVFLERHDGKDGFKEDSCSNRQETA